jgi:hypothetical protein
MRRVLLAAIVTVVAVAAPLFGSSEAVGKPLHHAGVVVQHSQLGGPYAMPPATQKSLQDICGP